MSNFIQITPFMHVDNIETVLAPNGHQKGGTEKKPRKIEEKEWRRRESKPGPRTRSRTRTGPKPEANPPP